MARSALLFAVLGLFAATAPAPAQNSLDPAFAGIPFKDWFKQGDRTHFRWSVEVADPGLSTHQRIVSRIRVKIDGDELVKRKGKGQFLILVQINDEKSGIWQSHNEIDLENLPDSMRSNDLEYLEPFFAMPGQYTVSIAVYDTATQEHNAARKKLKVSALSSDPLPQAWKNLPPIQFIPPVMPPDSWYLPSIEDQLYLPAGTKNKTRVDLLLNLTPAERLTGSSTVQNRQLAVLMPAFKALSQIKWSNAEVNAAFLDLSRRKVVFEQNAMKTLDWDEAGASLTQTTPGLIDVKTLEQRKFTADFFVKEISRRVSERGDSPRVVIVLTSPVTFDPGVDLNAIEASPRPGLKVFYIRYQPIPSALIANTRRGRFGEILPPRPSISPQGDQLEGLLKALNPRLFDVSSPIQFRKALAAIIAEVGAM